MIPHEYNEGGNNHVPSTEIKVFMEEFWAILYNVVNELDRIKQNYKTKSTDFNAIEAEVISLRKELTDATESVEALNIYVSDFKEKDTELEEAFFAISELRQQHSIDFQKVEEIKKEVEELRKERDQILTISDSRHEQLLHLLEEKRRTDELLVATEEKLVTYHEVEQRLVSSENERFTVEQELQEVLKAKLSSEETIQLLSSTEESLKVTFTQQSEEIVVLKERITFLETIHSDLQKNIEQKEQEYLQIFEEKEFNEQLYKEEQQSTEQKIQSSLSVEKLLRVERDELILKLKEIETRFAHQVDEHKLDRLQKENERSKLLHTIEELNEKDIQAQNNTNVLLEKLSKISQEFEEFKVRNTQEIYTLTEHKQLYEQLDQELEERLENEKVSFKKNEEDLLEQILHLEEKEDSVRKELMENTIQVRNYQVKLQESERVNLLLTDKKELLESQIDSMQQMVAEHVKQLEHSTNRTKLMEEYSQQLQAKSSALELKISEQQQIIDSKYHSSAESAEHIASLRGELDIFKADNTQLRERAEGHYRDLERTKSEISSLNQAVEILNRQMNSETSSKEELEKKLIEFSQLNSSLEEAQIMASSEFQITIAQQELLISNLNDQINSIKNENESMVPFEIVHGYQLQLSKLEEEIANVPLKLADINKESEEVIATLQNEIVSQTESKVALEQKMKTLYNKLDDFSNAAQLTELLKIQLEEKEREVDALNERLHLSEIALSMAQTQAALSKDQSENMDDFSSMLQTQQEKFMSLQNEIETMKESKAQLDNDPTIQDEELISKMKDMLDKL